MDLFSNLVDRKQMDKLSGEQKKAFKLALCGIFYNLIKGGSFSVEQNESYEILLKIKNKQFTRNEFIKLQEIMLPNVQNSLKSICFDNFKIDDTFMNEIVRLFRLVTKKKQQSQSALFHAAEFSKLFDLKKLCAPHSIKPYYWLDLIEGKGLFPTIPEMILFADLKAHWNYFVQTIHQNELETQSCSEENPFNHISLREKSHMLSALGRTLIVMGVTFVEAYLYNLFFHFKQEQTFDFKVLENEMVTDYEIVERIIFIAYPDSKEQIENHYNDFKNIISWRDRIIHASPFLDNSSKKSKLEPLLEVGIRNVVEALQTCLDFVFEVELLFKPEEKLLFWWYEGSIQFDKLEPLPLTNEKVWQ